jgi:hypothetical protein
LLASDAKDNLLEVSMLEQSKIVFQTPPTAAVKLISDRMAQLGSCGADWRQRVVEVKEACRQVVDKFPLGGRGDGGTDQNSQPVQKL